MKKIVLTFGLIAGAIVSFFMVLALAFKDAIGFDRGEIVGYTSMVVAFLFIYFGVRAYRDNVGGGTISFGRACAVGGLIAVVASACYVATWEVIYYRFTPDYLDKYREHVIAKARADGASQQAIADKTAQLEHLAELYKNPVINAGMTFLEPLPVAVIVVLVSAGVLSRRKSGQGVGVVENRGLSGAR